MNIQETTSILFPRFEDRVLTQEELLNPDSWQIPHVRPQKFFTREERIAFDGLINTLELGESEDVKGNWWGEYHTARRASVPTSLECVSPISGLPETIGVEVVEHTSLWDHQANEARQYEILLTRQNAEQATPEEAASMLVPVDPRRSKGEKMVILAGDDGWYEPSSQGIDDVRDHYLLSLLVIADQAQS